MATTLQRILGQLYSPRLQVAVPAAAVAGMLVVFLIDLLTPLGYVEWMLYLLPVGMALFQTHVALPYALAGVATVMIVIGFFASSTGVDPALAATNRSLGAVLTWVLAFVVHQALRAGTRAERLLWQQEGKTSIAQALMGELTPHEVGRNGARALCEVLGAQLGAVYRAEGKTITAVGGHAVDATSLPASLPAEHGLAGEALRTGRAIVVEDVPAGHLRVVTALGESEPRRLLVAPITADGRANGLVELGFVEARASLEAARELLPELGETVGVALRSALYRERLVELLDETQRQSEELQAQQEELRVANEELEEQSRALRESQARLETQQAELEQTNAQLEEQHAGAASAQKRRSAQARREREQLERGEPLQVRVPRQHVARAAHAAQQLADPVQAARRQPRRQAHRRAGALRADDPRRRTTTCWR